MSINIKWEEFPYELKQEVAHLTNDINLMFKLLRDKTVEPGVKAMLAHNHAATDEVLDELVSLDTFADTNKYWRLMEIIAKHPNTSPNTRHKIIEKNFESEDLFITLTIREDTLEKTLLTMLKNLIENRGYWFNPSRVIEHKNMPQDKLDELADFPKYQPAVASNRSTSEKTFVKLSKIKDYDTILSISWNPSAPNDVLQEISQYPVAWEGLIKNESTPEEVLDFLFNKLYDMSTGVLSRTLYAFNDKKVCNKTIHINPSSLLTSMGLMGYCSNISEKTLNKLYEAGFCSKPSIKTYCKK